MKLKTAIKYAGTLAIATWLAFSPLQEARAQGKADSAITRSLAKADSVKTQPKPKLMQPINFASLNRQSPNMWLIGGSSQILYFNKQSLTDNGDHMSIYMASFFSPDLQAGLHRHVKENPLAKTTMDGAAMRYAFNNGSFIVASRVGVSREEERKTGVIKTTPMLDAAATWASQFGLPFIFTAGFGSTEDYACISAGETNWALSAMYKNNAKTGSSYALGADYHLTYSGALSQRIYASLEQMVHQDKRTLIIGSRFMVPFGTIELNYEAVISALAAAKGNLSLRLTYSLN